MFTVHGTLRHPRAYYHCDGCAQGHCPRDDEPGLDGHWSPTLQAVVTLLGSLAPFAQAHDLLCQLTGLRFSTATVRRVTERVGAELQTQHARHETVARPQPPKWDFTWPDRDKRSFPGSVAYAGRDAFAVPTRGEGCGDWKRLYVGLLYDPSKEHPLSLADYDFERRAGLLRRDAVALGVGRAETLVALTDGGNGLERVLRQGISEAVVCVLDWWHLSERLHEVGRPLVERDARAATAWAQARETTLWHRGGKALGEELDRLRCPAEVGNEARAGWQFLREQVAKNEHRTDYPAYRERGWDVGSGPTAAGCQVLGQRLKGCGMRWEKAASLEVATLKALYASGLGLWEAFWKQRRPGHGCSSDRQK